MTFTDYHAKYFAHELARRCPSESKRPAESPRISSARNARFFAAQDQVDQQRGSLIANIEGKLFQSSRCTPVFTVRWKLA